MPNHVTNRVKLIGEPSEIRRVMEAVKVDDFGLGSLDFNKVIPMPADVFKGDLGEKERELYNRCVHLQTHLYILSFLAA